MKCPDIFNIHFAINIGKHLNGKNEETQNDRRKK